MSSRAKIPRGREREHHAPDVLEEVGNGRQHRGQMEEHVEGDRRRRDAEQLRDYDQVGGAGDG